MSADMNALITAHGYWALFVGCLAEGETLTLLAGIAAHEGLLHYGWVLLVAASGGALGDIILFFLGRYYGNTILHRFKRHQEKIAATHRLIQRYPSLFVIGVRFMYGLRIIGPLIIGTSHLRPATFLLLNSIGAILWATLFVSLGYLSGQIITPWLQMHGHPGKHLLWLLLAILLVWGGRRVIQYYKKPR